MTLLADKIQKINKTLKSFSLEAELKDGAIVASTEDYTSLNELLKDLPKIEKELGQMVELKTYRKIYSYNWEVFMANHNFTEDRDWAYRFSGDSEEEIRQTVEDYTNERDYESPEQKKEIQNVMFEAFKQNAEKVPHIQYYTNNDFYNLEKVVVLLDEIKTKHYMWANAGNDGAVDANKDYYTEEPAYIYFEAVEVEDYHIVTEVFSNGTTNILGEFEDLESAQEFLTKQLNDDGHKPGDFESWEIQVEKVDFDDDGSIWSSEVVSSQTMYSEGTIDRCNYKGDSAINYGFECVWNAKKQQLVYKMYFQGKLEDTVISSELDEWFYK